MNYRWLLFAYAALFVFGVCDNIRGPIFPELIRHFNISHSEGAWFFGLVSGTSVLSSIAVPRFIRLWGHVWVLRTALLFMGLSQMVFAAAPEFQLILLGSFLFGVGAGGVGVVQNVMVLLASPPQSHQKFQSGLHACYGAASIVSPLAVMILSDFQLSWQSVFWCSAVLTLAVLAMTFWGNENQDPKIATRWGSSSAASAKAQKRFWSFEEYFFSMILGLYVAVEILISTRTASYLRSELGIGLAESSFRLMILFLGLFAGRVLFIFWQPAKSLRFQMITVMVFVILAFAGSLLIWTDMILFTGLIMAPFYPLMMTALGRLFPERIGELAALCNALQGLVLVSMHGLVGVITDKAGISMAMAFGIILSIVTLLMLIFYPRIFKRAFG